LKGKILISIIIIAILAVFGFTLFKLVKENKELKSRIPRLTKGESIEYFDLINLDGERVDASILRTDKPTFIYLFPRPCAPCSPNIIYWNQMAKLMGDQGQSFGVILGGPNEVADFTGRKKARFKVFIPDDLTLCLNKLGINHRLAQTILYHRNEIKIVKLGELDGQSFTEMLKEAKKIVKRNMAEGG
jgi:hypothetical protein